MCKYCYSNDGAIYGKAMSFYEESWKCQCSFNSENLPFMFFAPGNLCYSVFM